MAETKWFSIVPATKNKNPRCCCISHLIKSETENNRLIIKSNDMNPGASSGPKEQFKHR